MKFFRDFLSEIVGLGRKLDSSSLQVRLTVGITVVTATGLGCVAILTIWSMQQILVTSQKQHIGYIAERFPQDVEIYSDMVPMTTGMQKAINNLTTGNTLMWVEGANGSVTAGSEALKFEPNIGLLNSQLTAQMSFIPTVEQVKGRYWVACGTPLLVKGKKLGIFYVAKDITSEYSMFLSLIRTFGIVSVMSIMAITVAIAFYVQRSLKPLREISQLTKTISANDLGQAHIHLERAPSEVRELAQTFDKMLVRLFDAWEQQRQFVSNVSHELRTPLTIVSGYLQSTLRRGTNLTLPQQEALSIAASEADRTIQLLQDLLDLARADNGRMHFNLEPLLLNELVAEVISMAEQYSHRVLKLEESNDRIEVKADRDRLKQVLLNLIDNAVKYSEADRSVTVRLQRISQKVTIQVQDRGQGIPLQQQSRIFERFYRVDEARTRSIGGTGLGLSIVKTLVEGMGGTVAVRSKLGEGSIFTVTLSTPISPG
ncbi:MAG: HAMP domain-containing sensor histidine kinase [Coleofasciculaceae cyanobacterium]